MLEGRELYHESNGGAARLTKTLAFSLPDSPNVVSNVRVERRSEENACSDKQCRGICSMKGKFLGGKGKRELALLLYRE